MANIEMVGKCGRVVMPEKDIRKALKKNFEFLNKKDKDAYESRLEAEAKERNKKNDKDKKDKKDIVEKKEKKNQKDKK